LPLGGALYFDSGVLEVATPAIELAKKSAVRAGRLLWEHVQLLRRSLDVWEQKNSKTACLEGFSAHYNISVFPDDIKDKGTLTELTLLLSFILPIPVMMLATNRTSTGIGVRPRRNRIEVTVDFTAEPEGIITTAALIAGITRAVLTWPNYKLSMLREHRIPVIACFNPRKHTSRQGWLARFDSFSRNPFTANIDVQNWLVEDGSQLSIREIAFRIAMMFRQSISYFGDYYTIDHMFRILQGHDNSLLDLDERPQAYQDVGRVNLGTIRATKNLRRSLYERVMQKVVNGYKLLANSTCYEPKEILNWFEVSFYDTRSQMHTVFTLEVLATLNSSFVK